MNAEPCLTIREVARRWRKRCAVVEQLIRTGVLPAFKIGKSTRISPEALAAFEKSQPAAPAKLKRKHRSVVVEKWY